MIVYLDFQKAFDTVPHCPLLKKLDAYGIKDQEFSNEFVHSKSFF